jgi:hypothetical protein
MNTKSWIFCYLGNQSTLKSHWDASAFEETMACLDQIGLTESEKSDDDNNNDNNELAERVGMTVEKLNFYRQSAKEVLSLDKKIDARTGKGSMSTGGDGEGNTMDIFVKDTQQPSPTELIYEISKRRKQNDNNNNASLGGGTSSSSANGDQSC